MAASEEVSEEVSEEAVRARPVGTVGLVGLVGHVRGKVVRASGVGTGGGSTAADMAATGGVTHMMTSMTTGRNDDDNNGARGSCHGIHRTSVWVGRKREDHLRDHKDRGAERAGQRAGQRAIQAKQEEAVNRTVRQTCSRAPYQRRPLRKAMRRVMRGVIASVRAAKGRLLLLVTMSAVTCRRMNGHHMSDTIGRGGAQGTGGRTAELMPLCGWRRRRPVCRPRMCGAVRHHWHPTDLYTNLYTVL